MKTIGAANFPGGIREKADSTGQARMDSNETFLSLCEEEERDLIL